MLHRTLLQPAVFSQCQLERTVCLSLPPQACLGCNDFCFETRISSLVQRGRSGRSAFNRRTIRYKSASRTAICSSEGCRVRLGTVQGLDRNAVQNLYRQVGWPNETAVANAWHALQCSQHVSVLQTESGNLVGLARATSDQAYNGTICDVVVAPDFQGQGYGRELVRCLVCTLLEQDIENITLFADAEAVSFYEGLGFERGVNRTKAMICLNSSLTIE